jgi:hypothetical protein
MRTGFILIATTALVCTGCATVDLQNMAGSSDVATTVQYESESNVVQRAVDKLRTTFASRGFGAKSSKRKMHAAADMLLNGLSARSVSESDEDYVAGAKTPAMIIEDIQVARGHVEQTTRAAEIYLEVAPNGRTFDDELESLEAALLASERAVTMFDTALLSDDPVELDSLRASVDGLRVITDEFGARVRLSRSDNSDADTTS